MFHHFHGGKHPVAQGSISAHTFEDMLHFVGLERIIGAQEFLDRALSCTLRGDEVCLTFDDNLLCQYEIALPIMEKHELTAFWFVFTGPLDGPAGTLEYFRHFRTVAFQSVDEFYNAFFATLDGHDLKAEIASALASIDINNYLAEFGFYTFNDRKFRYIRDKVLGLKRYESIMHIMMEEKHYDRAAARSLLWMSPEQWKQLHSCGHIIGMHTHTHPTDLSALPIESQRQEYSLNYAALSEILGSAPRCVSHPCNSYSKDTLDILRALGIEFGFRANMLKIPAPSNLEWPREDHANLERAMRVK